MAKTCVTEKTAKRQEWIENGLLELMQEHKFEEITVSQLCRHLTLSRRSFYRYFRDLEDVLDSMLDHTFQLLCMPDQVIGTEQMLWNFIFWKEHANLLHALHKSGMLDKLFEFTARYTANIAVDEYLMEEDIQNGLSREVQLFATYGSVSLALAWYMEGFHRSADEMAHIANRMLFQPLLKK